MFLKNKKNTFLTALAAATLLASAAGTYAMNDKPLPDDMRTRYRSMAKNNKKNGFNLSYYCIEDKDNHVIEEWNSPDFKINTTKSGFWNKTKNVFKNLSLAAIFTGGAELVRTCFVPHAETFIQSAGSYGAMVLLYGLGAKATIRMLRAPFIKHKSTLEESFDNLLYADVEKFFAQFNKI